MSEATQDAGALSPPGGTRRGRARQRTVYCTRAQWAAIGERAAAAGLPVSRLVVGCGLDEPGAQAPPRQGALFDHRLALTESEQRLLHERVAALERAAPLLLARAPGAHASLLEALRVLGDEAGTAPPEGVDTPWGAPERLGRSGAPVLTTHSVSCTDEEWAQIRARATRAGQSMSRYLVERALSAPVPGSADSRPASPRLVLDEAQQRALYACVERLAKLTHGAGAPAAAWRAPLAGAVEAILERAFEQRSRRGEPLRPALVRVLGARRAARVGARLEARRRAGASGAADADAHRSGP